MSYFRAENVSSSGRCDRRFIAVLLGILALAALLRLGLMRTEFWFDEIWSWEFARAAASPWQVFAGEHHHHDNNHKLNTLLLSLYPQGADWWCYRLHSFVAGLGAVAFAALVAYSAAASKRCSPPSSSPRITGWCCVPPKCAATPSLSFSLCWHCTRCVNIWRMAGGGCLSSSGSA